MTTLPTDYVPEFETIKDLLLEMARERSLSRLLTTILRRFAERPHLALSRIWLLHPGDRCETCTLRSDCENQPECLHLVASAGRSAVDPKADLTRIDGGHSRWPVGVGKIGRIARSKEAYSVRDVQQADGPFDRDWARREKIIGFSAEPLLHQDQVLGVIAIFVRIAFPETPTSRRWLRLVADHAASAIANARAFTEIERLRSQIADENAYLRAEVRETAAYHEILGESPALENLRRQIELVAPTEASVLILGESGTGKELAAREIHLQSQREESPLIKVNCAAIPHSLYESEFFGHVKGAFTGAVKDRPGRFELANGGTLLLDEVGEIPVELQTRLLRVLQEGQFERVGDDITRQVDVRILAASNRDLAKEVQAGRFREDLFYRLNVFPIRIAPLRERREDIPLLTEHFLDLAARRLNRPCPQLDPEHHELLQQYDWPGNVRELQNVVERAMITAADGKLRFDLGDEHTSPILGHGLLAAAGTRVQEVIPMAEWRRRERENLRAALLRCL